MRLFDKANYSFLQKARTAAFFSVSLIVLGFVFMVVNINSIGSWQNYGVDFSGGSLIQVRFDTGVSFLHTGVVL